MCCGRDRMRSEVSRLLRATSPCPASAPGGERIGQTDPVVWQKCVLTDQGGIKCPGDGCLIHGEADEDKFLTPVPPRLLPQQCHGIQPF
jgi:hypothetical protein